MANEQELGGGVDKDYEQLKMLFDYTKFHIGVYISIATILGAAITAKDGPFALIPSMAIWFKVAVLAICVAGLAGGIIASSATQFQSYAKFWTARIGPFRREWLTTEDWSYIEHVSFWAALGCAVIAISTK